MIKVYSTKHIEDIDIAYWMPKTADNYDTRTTISLKPDNWLDKDGVTFPTIPVAAIEVEIESPLTDDSRGMEGIAAFMRVLFSFFSTT